MCAVAMETREGSGGELQLVLDLLRDLILMRGPSDEIVMVKNVTYLQ